MSETAIDFHEPHTTGRHADERAHAAWTGDEDEFRRIAEDHRGAIYSHCRRMLASPHDADDAFQETMLRAWLALPRFQGRSSLRSWLYRIATNVCIDAIKRRKRRPPRMPQSEPGPPTDTGSNAPTWPAFETVLIKHHRDQDLGVEDAATAPQARYEHRESVKHAFLVARECLPARQHNVLILRDVLDFSAKEAAEILDTTVAAINSALQRARAAFDEGPPEQSRQTTPRSRFDTRMDAAERFVNAVESGDIDTILRLLAERPWALASRRG